ncbi:unnamed protein product [Pseudo-nitzschia multistriata]|uniref:Uncharacterized protein n=1 Tax=Pseudo-nitzschia multistriata TaxID=183589 RepID=A0A448Z9J1_9STRA|nr:unnamed protein product [Pseudo-nitzschia multistriata]
MVFRKIFKGRRSRSRKEKSFSDAISIDASISSRSCRKGPTRYDGAFVETVTTTMEEQDADCYDCNPQRNDSHAIYMFPTAWKERTGSRCDGAYDTIDTENRTKTTLQDDDDSITEMKNYEMGWDLAVDVNEDRYKSKEDSLSWVESSLSCLACV